MSSFIFTDNILFSLMFNRKSPMNKVSALHVSQYFASSVLEHYQEATEKKKLDYGIFEKIVFSQKPLLIKIIKY